MAKVEKIVWPIATKAAQEHGCSVYDVEFLKEGQNYFLRIYIDKDGGVSTDDCEKVSRTIDPMIDEADPIEQAYFLEISSPGLDRKLSRPEHFADNAGKRVELKLYSAIDGSKELEGELAGLDGDIITIIKDNGDKIQIEKQKASVVRLAVVL